MGEKKSDGITPFQQLLSYPGLFNPASTFFSTFGDKVDNLLNSPSGKLKLSKDPLFNHALWNTIYSSALFGGGALLLSLLANKQQEDTVRKAMKSGVSSRLEAIRPTLVADPDLKNLSAYTNLPEQDIKRVEKLLAKSDDQIEKKAGDYDGQGTGTIVAKHLGDLLSNTAAKAVASALPLTATTLAVAGGIWGGNELIKKRLKAKLKRERINIKNAQAYIDRKILQEQGLIAPDKEEDSETLPKRADAPDTDRGGLLTSILQMGPIWWLLSGLGLGGVSYAMAANRDKNLATVKQLSKMQFGKNELQSAPSISILDIPAKPEEMLKLPGDKKEETYASDRTTEHAKKALTKSLANKKPVEIIDVEPIDSADIVRAVKKDALFI